jgi:WXXGXW repeat (2 copies)
MLRLLAVRWRSGRPLFLLPLFLIALPSCAEDPPPHAIYVVATPPPERVEVVGVAPGPRYVWVQGHWHWTGDAYVWVPGSWAGRPSPNAVWVAGHWRHVRGGWVWVPGHWR